MKPHERFLLSYRSNCPIQEPSLVFCGGSDSKLPTMWETQVQFLGREDLLEKEMTTHSSIFAWKIPWMEEPGRVQFMGSFVDADNLISGSSAFSKSSLNTWKLTVHILLKPGLEHFEHYFTSMCNECNCVVV